MSATDFPTLADCLASLHSAGIVSAPAGLGLIRVAGDDAATFLHSQLTNGLASASH